MHPSTSTCKRARKARRPPAVRIALQHPKVLCRPLQSCLQGPRACFSAGRKQPALSARLCRTTRGTCRHAVQRDDAHAGMRSPSGLPEQVHTSAAARSSAVWTSAARRSTRSLPRRSACAVSPRSASIWLASACRMSIAKRHQVSCCSGTNELLVAAALDPLGPVSCARRRRQDAGTSIASACKHIYGYTPQHN